MLLNVSDVLTSEGKVLNKEIPLELTQVTYNGENFDIVDKEVVTLNFCNVGENKAEVSGNTSVAVIIPCSRCLEEVSCKITLQFVRTIAAELEDQLEDEDDAGVMEGYHLNVETLVYNEILMSWPAKVLCKEDCKGICKACGADLNNGECGCDTFVPDPRMAAIKDIFDANKEV